MNNLDEADATIALSREVGRHVVVNNQFRFMHIHQAAKKRIGAPDFGNLLFLTMHQTFFVTEKTEAGWRGQDLRRTGAGSAARAFCERLEIGRLRRERVDCAKRTGRLF